jgi:hypothetical protein
MRPFTRLFFQQSLTLLFLSTLIYKNRTTIMKVRFFIGTLNTGRCDITLRLIGEDIIKVELK